MCIYVYAHTRITHIKREKREPTNDTAKVVARARASLIYIYKYMYIRVRSRVVEMPFNLKSLRPSDISNNNATTTAAAAGSRVRGPFNSGQKAMSPPSLWCPHPPCPATLCKKSGGS